MSVSFCLPHPVAVSAFMICRGLCACTEMLWMCVLYVSFGSKVRPRTFGCVAMGSALLFIVRSRLLVYSAGSGVNRVQVVLSGFSNRLFCFVQAKTLCRYGCMYFLAALVLVCVDVIQTTQPTSGGAVTADKNCCANCVEPSRPQQWGPDLPFFGHADPLDGWRCCSQKRVMSRPIHHMVTNSIRHKHQQTTDNIKHRIQISN